MLSEKKYLLLLSEGNSRLHKCLFAYDNVVFEICDEHKYLIRHYLLLELHKGN